MLAAVYWARVPRVVLPDRALRLPTFCHSLLTRPSNNVDAVPGVLTATSAESPWHVLPAPNGAQVIARPPHRVLCSSQSPCCTHLTSACRSWCSLSTLARSARYRASLRTVQSFPVHSYDVLCTQYPGIRRA